MRDSYFTYFIEKFGEATHQTLISSADIDYWASRLPPILLEYWRNEGWAGYANGRLWTVNPDEYEDIKNAWLEGTPFSRFDTFHVIARSAFGDLFLCGEKTGRSLMISCPFNELFALKGKLKTKSLENQNTSIQSFFASRTPEDFDFIDANGNLLFDRAVEVYGPLGPDEMYGFEPALVLGGHPLLENVRRLKTDPHLHILRQFDPPTLPFSSAEIEKLMGFA